MRAGFWFDPCRFWWHCRAFVCDLEQGFYLELTDEEDYLMFVEVILVDYPRHVFQFLQELFIQEGGEDLILQSKRRHFLHYVH